MVNDAAQLYTIEGIAAGLIMLLTAYMVVNATSVYTPGDTHISDMQLEALGTDALMMMDIANSSDIGMTPLRDSIENDRPDIFRIYFTNFTSNLTSQRHDRVQYMANYTCRNKADNSTTSYFLDQTRPLRGGEHAVRATKWVIVNKALCSGMAVQERAVLAEVLLWRD
jgi:hypothetical protein